MRKKRGYILIFLAAFIYSTTEVALKLLSGYFAPMQLTTERVAIGVLVLLPFALMNLKKNEMHVTKTEWEHIALIGFVSVALQMAFLQMAVTDIDASSAATIYSGSPIISIFTAHIILREPVKKSHVIALSLMLMGIIVIMDPAHLTMSISGFCKVMFSTIAFGVYGVLCKLWLGRFSGIVVSCFTLMLGDLQMLALIIAGKIPAVALVFRRIGLGIFADVPMLVGFTPKTFAVLFYVGAVVAGLGFFLYAQIVKDTSAIEASFVYLLKPVFATVIASRVLHEAITTSRLIGIAFFAVASLCTSIPGLMEMGQKNGGWFPTRYR